MDKPNITPLPIAPNRSQAPAEFAARADDFVGALPNFRDQLQMSIDYVEYVFGEVDSAKSVAQSSATTATAAANAAENSASSADQSFQDILVVAAAVQESAGMPTLAGNAGRALVVNPAANGVMWGPLLGTNGQGNKTVSTSDPSGGANGDIWYQVEE